jgi:hypothetical protein
MVFSVQQNNTSDNLLNALLGETAGLSNISIRLLGDARAFGTFENDPFGLDSGIVLSTGQVANLPLQNTVDGGTVPVSVGSSADVVFEPLEGEINGTTIFRADLSNINFAINSITVADSGSAQGGATGPFSGFDLDGVFLSEKLISDASNIEDLIEESLSVFDFSPGNIIFKPGTQRPPTNPGDAEIAEELVGTKNGIVDNSIVTLGAIDGRALPLGDGGEISFSLTDTVPVEEDQPDTVPVESAPLYLYIGEGGLDGEGADGQLIVSERALNDDLSSDFGLPGAENDSISMEIEFDADETVDFVYFQFVFGSEELVEYGGDQFNDRFSLELNGFNFAQLNDGSEVSINTLAPNAFGPFNEDLVRNPVETGPAAAETRLDGYTKPLTFVGFVEPNATNTLTLTVEDIRDGLLDSAVFVKGGTLGTIEPPAIPDNNDSDGDGDEEGEDVEDPGVTITPVEVPLELDEGGTAGAFSIVLDTRPTELVTIIVAPDNQLDLGRGVNNPVSVTFTPDNAFVPQTVSVAAIVDGIFEGDHTGKVDFLASSEDSNYDSSSLDFNGEGLTIPSLIINISDSDTDGGNGPSGNNGSGGELSFTESGFLCVEGDSQTTNLKFGLSESSAGFINEVGLFIVDDGQGSVNGLQPGENGYLDAALGRSQIIFSALANNQFSSFDFSRQLGFKSGQCLGFYLISNDTTDNLLSNRSSGNTTTNIFFSNINANVDRFSYLKTNRLSDNKFEFSWEDSFGGGDLDFNDLVFQVETTQGVSKIGSRLQNLPGKEVIDLTLYDGQVLEASFSVESSAEYQNIVGLYRIDSAEGIVTDPLTGLTIAPGSGGYAEAVLRLSIMEFDRNGTTSIALEGGQLYAPYLLADGDSELMYVPYLEANVDGLDHVRLLGSNIFAFEDWLGGGDRDYNDLVFSINIASPSPV